jgi:hypothetical protein
LTKGKLIDKCIAKFGGKKSSYENSDMKSPIQRLSTYQTDPTYIALQNGRVHDAESMSNSFLHTSFLKQIVKSSFLPKLIAKGKEYCKMGHNLELQICTKASSAFKGGTRHFPS